MWWTNAYSNSIYIITVVWSSLSAHLPEVMWLECLVHSIFISINLFYMKYMNNPQNLPVDESVSVVFEFANERSSCAQTCRLIINCLFKHNCMNSPWSICCRVLHNTTKNRCENDDSNGNLHKLKYSKCCTCSYLVYIMCFLLGNKCVGDCCWLTMTKNTATVQHVKVFSIWGFQLIVSWMFWYININIYIGHLYMDCTFLHSHVYWSQHWKKLGKSWYSWYWKLIK